MAKYKRMINVEFVDAGSFKVHTSNRAKLLYFFMLCNADDKGFCDNADELIILLDNNDKKFDNVQQPVLVESNYSTALKELLDTGRLIPFSDNHNNRIYLIRHWYSHNQIPKDRIRDSAYERFLKGFVVNKDGKYVKQVSNKCNTSADTNEIKNNENKLNDDESDMNNEQTDSESEGEESANDDWSNNLEETIRIAKTPWLDEDD